MNRYDYVVIIYFIMMIIEPNWNWGDEGWFDQKLAMAFSVNIFRSPYIGELCVYLLLYDNNLFSHCEHNVNGWVHVDVLDELDVERRVTIRCGSRAGILMSQ